MADQMRSPGCTRAAVVLPAESQHFKLIESKKTVFKEYLQKKGLGHKDAHAVPHAS